MKYGVMDVEYQRMQKLEKSIVLESVGSWVQAMRKHGILEVSYMLTSWTFWRTIEDFLATTFTYSSLTLAVKLIYGQYQSSILKPASITFSIVFYRSRKDFYWNAATLSLLLVQDDTAQDYLYSVLPSPTTIPVEEGDLLLLSTQRPHAVKKPLLGSQERISFQGFIQYRQGQPLFLEV